MKPNGSFYFHSSLAQFSLQCRNLICLLISPAPEAEKHEPLLGLPLHPLQLQRPTL